MWTKVWRLGLHGTSCSRGLEGSQIKYVCALCKWNHWSQPGLPDESKFMAWKECVQRGQSQLPDNCEHWDYPDSESISVVAFEAWFHLWNCYLHFTCRYIFWNDLVAVGNVIKLSILIPLRCDPTHVSESWLFLFGRSTYEYTYTYYILLYIYYIYNIIMIYHWSKFPLVFGILQNYDSSLGLRTEPNPAVLNAANHGVMVPGPTMGIECCEDSRICLWGH